LNTTDLEQ